MAEARTFTQQNPIRVFLLDDHEIVRRGLTDLLDSEPDISVVGDADSAEHALVRGRRCARTWPSSTYACRTVTESVSAVSCAAGCRSWPVRC